MNVSKCEAFVRDIAAMFHDGELVDGREYVMETDDAVATLGSLIQIARELQAS